MESEGIGLMDLAAAGREYPQFGRSTWNTERHSSEVFGAYGLSSVQGNGGSSCRCGGNCSGGGGAGEPGVCGCGGNCGGNTSACSNGCCNGEKKPRKPTSGKKAPCPCDESACTIAYAQLQRHVYGLPPHREKLFPGIDCLLAVARAQLACVPYRTCAARARAHGYDCPDPYTSWPNCEDDCVHRTVAQCILEPKTCGKKNDDCDAYTKEKIYCELNGSFCEWYLKCVCKKMGNSVGMRCMRKCLQCVKSEIGKPDVDAHVRCQTACDRVWTDEDEKAFLNGVRECMFCTNGNIREFFVFFAGWRRLPGGGWVCEYRE